METIAVIDDRQKMRETVVAVIVRALKKLGVDWNVIESAPLPAIEDYAEWIQDNDVLVLVLDEKLNEEVAGGDGIEYSGHQVAELVRRQFPDLPQFIVTAIADSEDLEDASQLDAVVAREEFMNHSNTYVERMVRIGMSYSKRYSEELADLTALSEKLASGSLSSEELDRLNSLRGKVQASAEIDSMIGLSSWIESAREIEAKLARALEVVERRARS